MGFEYPCEGCLNALVAQLEEVVASKTTTVRVRISPRAIGEA